MEAQPDRNKLLMSDTLRGIVNEALPEPETGEGFVIGIIKIRSAAGTEETLVGSVTTYLFDEANELEVRVELDEAFLLTMAKNDGSLVVEDYELHHHETVMTVAGPFTVPALRMSDIDHARQTCVLAMKLQRQ